MGKRFLTTHVPIWNFRAFQESGAMVNLSANGYVCLQVQDQSVADALAALLGKEVVESNGWFTIHTDWTQPKDIANFIVPDGLALSVIATLSPHIR